LLLYNIIDCYCVIYNYVIIVIVLDSTVWYSNFTKSGDIFRVWYYSG